MKDINLLSLFFAFLFFFFDIVKTYWSKRDSWLNLVCLFPRECTWMPSCLIVLMQNWYCLRIVTERRLDTFWGNSQTIAYITRVSCNAAPSSFNCSTIQHHTTQCVTIHNTQLCKPNASHCLPQFIRLSLFWTALKYCVCVSRSITPSSVCTKFGERRIVVSIWNYR